MAHKFDGVIFTLGSKRGSQYECACGWRSKHYKDETARVAAAAAVDKHVEAGNA